MNQHRSNLRKVAFAACAGLTASLVLACSGDDSSTPPPDSGTDSASTGSHSSSSTSSSSTTHSSSSSTSSATADAAMDSTTTGDAAQDAPSTDSTVDGTTDAPSDAAHDSAAEAEAASMPPTAPAVCDQFDAIYGNITTDGGTASAENQRAQEWASDLSSEFANEVLADCRFGKMQTLVNSTQSSDWANELLAYVQAMVGCPIVPAADGGGLGYALIPPNLVSHSFSSADLAALNAILVNAMNVTLTADVTPEPPLTTSQANAILAELEYYQATVPAQFVGTTYTYDNCADGGTDGGDGGDGG